MENFLLSIVGADAHIGPKTKEPRVPIFQSVSGSGAGTETILHLRPLAKHSQSRGTHHNNLKRAERA